MRVASADDLESQRRARALQDLPQLPAALTEVRRRDLLDQPRAGRDPALEQTRSSPSRAETIPRKPFHLRRAVAGIPAPAREAQRRRREQRSHQRGHVPLGAARGQDPVQAPASLRSAGPGHVRDQKPHVLVVVALNEHDLARDLLAQHLP